MPRHNTDPVTLPAAAENAAHALDDKFDFSETNAHVPPQQTEPLEHVAEQAEEHVPDSVPPEGLPSEALENMADMAIAHVPDWLLPDG